MLWPTLLALAAALALLLVVRRDRRRLAASQRERSLERKEAEVRLRRSERDRTLAQDRLDAADRRFVHVVEACERPMLLAGPGGRVASANGAAATLLQTHVEDLVGAALHDLLLEHTAVRRDGTKVPVRAARSVWKEAGELHSVVWIHETLPEVQAREDAEARARLESDVGELRRELHARKRLADIGLAALGCGEHLRGPLASLRTSASLLESGLTGSIEKDATKTDLARAIVAAIGHEEMIMNDVERMERIVKTLEDATRFEDGDPSPTDVNVVAEDALQAAGPHLAGVRVHREFLANAHALVVPREMHEVLHALVRHAADAVTHAGGGDVTVLTMDTPERVVVEVTDTAPIDPEKDARGMWLGRPGTPGHLATGHTILDARGGRLSFVAHPGAGATFRVEVPLAPPFKRGGGSG